MPDNTPRYRKNIVNLSQTETENLRKAFRGLQADASKKNYGSFVGIHQSVCNSQNPPHKNELFLPWHRAFIFLFENALRRFQQDVTLPYWDWVQTPQIPQPFAEDGGNPLYIADRFTDKQRVGLLLPSQSDVSAALNDSDFFSFGGGYEGWVREGDLEQLHDYVHNWVGPVMEELATSPRDPIFWAHHANVDRLWANWQAQQSDGPHDPSEVLPNLPGYTVADTLDIRGSKLGYEYVEQTDSLDFGTSSLKEVSYSKSMLRVPSLYSKAELRLEGLAPRGGVPRYLNVYLNGENHAGTRPIFGIAGHHSSGRKSMKMRNHEHRESLVLDVTAALSRIPRGTEIVFRLVLSNPLGSSKKPLGLAFDRIVLAFLP
jgi:tyrosinase